MNLAVKQEKEALRILRLLVKKSKGLLPEIELELWSYYPPCASGARQRLYLNQHGLWFESGYYDRCSDSSDCIITTHQDRSDKPRKLQPSLKVVRGYNLEANALKRILKKIKLNRL